MNAYWYLMLALFLANVAYIGMNMAGMLPFKSRTTRIFTGNVNLAASLVLAFNLYEFYPA